MYQEKENEKLYCMSNAVSRSISAENPTGEKGKGGMATEGALDMYARELGQGWKVSPSIKLEKGGERVIADIEGPGIIKHMWIVGRIPCTRQIILRIYYDGSDKPSVEVPHADFFACSDYRLSTHPTTPLINSAKVCVNSTGGFNCFWEIPFYKRCRITVENLYDDVLDLFYQIDYVLTELPENCLYFHAQFRRENPTKYKVPYTILDNVHGRGKYVGTYLFWGVHNNGWWGEGEIKFYLDGDKDFPTICGTGTEDYFGGAWCYHVEGENKRKKYREYNTPYMGFYRTQVKDGEELSQERFYQYRWHVVDPIYFSEDIKVTIQALGWRSKGRYMPLQDDISSVAFWYQEGICQTFPKLPDVNELEII